MNNPNQQNPEPRKHAMITAEQEALLRAYEEAKKLQYGEINLYINAGKITNYNILKSYKNEDGKKDNVEMLKNLKDDTGELETIAI